MEQSIGFCTTGDGVQIAYAVTGQGYPLVRVLGWGTHVEYDFQTPLWRPMLQALAERFRLVRYDGRGTGLSDRGVKEHTLEKWAADLETVIEATGLDRFAILGISQGGSAAINYAVKHPERVSHLILYGSFAEPPIDMTDPESRALFDSILTMTRIGWGQNNPTYRQVMTSMFVPGATMEQQKQFDDLQRTAMEAEDVVTLLTSVSKVDVRDLLPQVKVPTLVLHRRGDSAVPFERGRTMAAGIPKAKFVPLEGENHVYLEQEQGIEDWIRAIVAFVDPDAQAKTEDQSSAFRTVLFTDLVGHTEMMQRLGDDKGRDVLREHERITREVLKENGGTEVKTMGDGFMASFTSVQKAVECSIALQRAFDVHNQSQAEPMSVRVGLNAGEPIEEDGDLFGSTVILAARVAAKAAGGEILASDVMRGLCSGKGFLFADRGDHVMKGFEEPVKVYEISWRG
jgi:class 3 adenylate cyclase